jgi:hypothetical protein
MVTPTMKVQSKVINFLCSVCQYLPVRIQNVLDWILVPLAEKYTIGIDRDEPLF